jgi:hypothetical protein
MIDKFEAYSVWNIFINFIYILSRQYEVVKPVLNLYMMCLEVQRMNKLNFLFLYS